MALRASLEKWAFAVVPAIAIVELGLHFWQAGPGVVPESDWKSAREAVRAVAKPEDLVLFAPRWTDPLGREYFKDDVATLSREAFPDVTRFPRAVEVSIRGKHRPELDGWRAVAKQDVGKITLTTYENPAPAKVLDDLVQRATPETMTVLRIDGPREAPCTYGVTSAQTGGLGFGPAVPAARWNCPGGGFAGVSVLPALDFTPRRCIYAPPQGGVLRIVWKDVRFGRGLHGHHGIYVEAERFRNGAPVSLTFSAQDKPIGKVTHVDGDGWKGFELDTSDLEGKRADLVADITTPNPARRQYCFEADTR